MFSSMFSLHIDGVIKKKKYIMYYVINSMFLFIFIVFFDCRCCYHHYSDDVTTHFLLLKHFWPWFNNVLHQNEGLHIDGLNKKIIISPTGVKMHVPYPCTPAWRHFVVLTPYNHGTPKKWEKNVHNYFIHRHIDPVYGLLNVP